MGFHGDSGAKNPPANAGNAYSIPGSGRSPGGGNGNPDTTEHTHTYTQHSLVRVQKEKERKGQKLFEEVMAEGFPNMVKETDI